jgi:hypothetical protein
MKRRLTISLLAGLLVMIFGGLRVYGAYQTEQDAALSRAAEAGKEAEKLQEQADRIDRQSKCNQQWQEYKIARLKQRNVELRGQYAPEPREPFCSGYEAKLDESLDLIMKGADASFGAIAAREYVRLEKAYAADRRLQTRYLGVRLWAFLTGAEPKVKPAELVKAKEHAVNVTRCLENTKKDKAVLASASDFVEKYGKKKLATRTPETVCEAYVSTLIGGGQ